MSIDIDVLDPAFAPGTGTPEIAGMTTREMVNVLRGLSGLNLVSADVVEVSPAYDHAEVTSLAAATIVYELTNLFAKSERKCSSEERAFWLMMFIVKFTFRSCIINNRPLG